MNFEDELDRSTRSHIKDLIAISNNKDERDQLNLIINNIKPDETKQIITVLEKIYRKCLDEKIKNLIIDKIGVFFINEVEFLIQEFRFELEHNVPELDIHELFKKPKSIRSINVDQSKKIWGNLCKLDTHYENEKSVDIVFPFFDEILLSGNHEQQKRVKRNYKYLRTVLLEEIEFLVEDYPLNFE